MNIETKRKLNAMNMQDIAESIEAQEVNPAFYAQLSFEERLSSLIDDIYQKRHNEKIQRRIKQAKLRYPSASIADVDYVSRKLDKGLLNELGTMNFLSSSTNIVIQGFTGSGKTYLSCAIAKEACKKDIKTFTIRLPEMLQKRAEEKILHRENISLSEDDIRFLYELFELRYGKSSTIFVGQYPTTEWHTRLGGGAHADSILDRIVHNIIIIESGSINMRELLDSKKYKHQI